MVTVKSQNLQVYPENGSEVARLVKFAAKRKLLVVPVNRGSYLEKASLGKRNHIILNLSRLTRIVDLSSEDFFITVQAGYRISDLNPRLSRYGLFFPFSCPGLQQSAASLVCKNVSAEIGGEVVEVKKFTLALEVVTASGEIVNTGRVTFKNVVGYDLVRLFCGSWGSLGIVTAATFRLLPLARLREYRDLKFLECEIPSLQKVKGSAKRELIQSIKSVLDPKGVFLSHPV